MADRPYDYLFSCRVTSEMEPGLFMDLNTEVVSPSTCGTFVGPICLVGHKSPLDKINDLSYDDVEVSLLEWRLM